MKKLSFIVIGIALAVAPACGKDKKADAPASPAAATGSAAPAPAAAAPAADPAAKPAAADPAKKADDKGGW